MLEMFAFAFFFCVFFPVVFFFSQLSLQSTLNQRKEKTAKSKTNSNKAEKKGFHFVRIYIQDTKK
jgi:hypothetical protein